MNKEKSITGSKAVDEISMLNINSIPESWYKNIRSPKGPNALAILILWDLLYWYKWTEVRDEHSGEVIGYKKKFKADCLQRSYSSIADKFGISKKQATSVLNDLEDLGIIKKHLRTITVGELKMSNVLFIELIPDAIKQISSFSAADLSSNNPQNDTPYHPNGIEVYTQMGDSSISKRDRQIQSITTNNYNNHNYANSDEFANEGESETEDELNNTTLDTPILSENEKQNNIPNYTYIEKPSQTHEDCSESIQIEKTTNISTYIKKTKSKRNSKKEPTLLQQIKNYYLQKRRELYEAGKCPTPLDSTNGVVINQRLNALIKQGITYEQFCKVFDLASKRDYHVRTLEYKFLPLIKESVFMNLYNDKDCHAVQPVEPKEVPVMKNIMIKKCSKCGEELNSFGECPWCN